MLAKHLKEKEANGKLIRDIVNGKFDNNIKTDKDEDNRG